MNEFEKSIRGQLRSAERDLDPDTVAALSTMRKDILAHAGKRHLPRFFVPAFSMAMASVVAMILVFSPATDNTDQVSPSSPKLSENIEIYEDMDFYYWLAQAGDDLKG